MELNRRSFLSLSAAGFAAAALPAWTRSLSAPPPALLFRDVRVIDGTGAPARLADVLVRDGHIAQVGRIAANAVPGAQLVKGDGRVLAPGFIDLHVHGDPLNQSYVSHLAMGSTTVVMGQDGSSPALEGKPSGTGAWFEALRRSRPDINVATTSGHGSLRRMAGIDDGTRIPSEAQVARMAELLEADLRAGSFGLSTGLEYVPGIYSSPGEIAPLGRLLARYDAVAMSHMRSEDEDKVDAAIMEHIQASMPARTHVSHLKVVHGHGPERAERTLASLQEQRDNGLPLTADAYPYIASYTTIGILFPEWSLPPTDYLQVLSTRRDELRKALEQRMTQRGGPTALLFGSGEHAGKTLAEVAQALGQPWPDVLLALGPQGGSAAHFVMDKELQARIMVDPYVAIASDGSPSFRHPRGYGTFSTWIEEYVVKEARVSLEEGIRKATSLPARILGLHDRGVVREGAVADLVLFDPAAVRSRADYVNPFQLAAGFDLVLLNGQPAWQDGEATGVRGACIRRGAAATA